MEEYVTENVENMYQPGYTQLASVLVVDSQEILMMLRSENDTYGGLWGVPNGHVEPGESYEHAANRELLEETGISGLKLAPLLVYINHKHRLESHVFLYKGRPSFKNQEPSICTEIKWVEYSDIADMPTTPGITTLFDKYASLLL